MDRSDSVPDFPDVSTGGPLAQVLRAFESITEVEPEAKLAEIATVAVHHSGGWHHLKTVVRPVRSTPSDIARIDRRAAFFKRYLEFADLTVEDHLAEHLTGWRRELEIPHGFSFQPQNNVGRHPSQPPSGFPEIEFRLHEQDPNKAQVTAPSEPYMSADGTIFGSTVGAAARDWLALPDFPNNPAASSEYLVRIHDHRGRIAGLEEGELSLVVTVEGTHVEGLHVGATYRGSSGGDKHCSGAVREGKAELRFDSSVEFLRVWLMHPDGYWLDKYEEQPGYGSWGLEHAIYNRTSRLQGDGFGEISTLIEGGESDQVEFKSFVYLRNRDSKAREILETAAAFANAAGGTLLVGVDDYGLPKGISTANLNKSYRQVASGDFEKMRELYVVDLKRLLAEGLTPPVSIQATWVEIAHNQILRIDVTPGERRATSLIETGQAYVRVGATNQLLRVGDLPSLRRLHDPP